MASLFGDLPEARRASPPPRAASQEVEEPPAKRARAEEPAGARCAPCSAWACVRALTCATHACAEAPARPAGAGSGDEVSAALERLTVHAGNAKKFRKVAELATQLLADGQLARKHGKAVFQARKAANAVLGSDNASDAHHSRSQFLEAAMADPARVTAPECRVEFGALLRAARGCAERGVLNAKHCAALDVWCLAGLTANALFTDDSYEFSRTAAEVRAAFAALPGACFEIWRCRLARPLTRGPRADYEAEPAAEEPSEAPPLPPDASPEEAEAAAAAFAAAAAAERAAALAELALASARRDALLSCVEAAHASYRWPWAQTTVDQLVDAAHAVAATKLSPAQQERLHRTYIQARVVATRSKRHNACLTCCILLLAGSRRAHPEAHGRRRRWWRRRRPDVVRARRSALCGR